MAYHMNGFLITPTGLPLAALSEPVKTLFLSEGGGLNQFDEAYLRPNQEGGNSFDLPISNHHGGGNVVLADGHVKWYDDRQWTAAYLREQP